MKKYILFIVITIITLITVCGCSNNNNPVNNSTVSSSFTINDAMGNKVNIDVFVNDVKVKTPVYANLLSPPVEGPDNVSDYVLLKPVCEAMKATFKLNDSSIKIKYKGKKYTISQPFNEPCFWVVDDNVYVEFSSIRYAMDGTLKQDDYKSMYLYTKDFARPDIPATLDECYKALDKELDEKTKNEIKNAGVEDLSKYHFGLGQWIRNNWIYATEDRISKFFLDKGIKHPDDMSSIIITGYYYYLNNAPYNFEAEH